MSKDSTVTTIDDQPDTVETPTASKAKAKAAVKGANHDVELSGKTRTITIHTSDAEGGHDAVFLSINGYGYQIPRGTPVEVPEEVLHVLENAKVTTYSPSKNPGEFVERTTHRYAFSAH
jgi:hypothetical protein